MANGTPDSCPHDIEKMRRAAISHLRAIGAIHRGASDFDHSQCKPLSASSLIEVLVGKFGGNCRERAEAVVGGLGKFGCVKFVHNFLISIEIRRA